MAVRKARPGEINYPLLDRFSVVHGAVGVAAGAAGTSFLTAVALTVGFELVEDRIKRANPRLFPVSTTDTAANKVGDSVVFLGGWALGRRFRR